MSNSLSPGDFSDQRFARYENALEILANIRDTVGQLDPQWSQDSKDQEFQGGFGYIKKAVWNNRLIAVKFLRDRQDGCSQKQPFRREVMVWHKLNHPNILPLLGVVSSGDTYLGMASPYMENGPASGYVHRNPEANVLQILCDVAAGMAYLASQTPPIAHGDLKGANVLIDSSGRACICDFGLSRFIEDLKSADVSCSGTMRWMAPEQLIADTMMVSLSADIFSWGMLALELMTGTKPWSDIKNDYSVVPKVVSRLRPSRPHAHSKLCKLRKERPECVCLVEDDELWKLIQHCWEHDPDQRPNITELRAALLGITKRFSLTKSQIVEEDTDVQPYLPPLELPPITFTGFYLCAGYVHVLCAAMFVFLACFGCTWNWATAAS
ncbi:unnamed protein product [Rhizoctonia solani]|uniref:Protein kinase domain-containing protein n=1 Tax=Rhizoctonia solani TaxID=456999 RepID=A0A8H2W7S7_9AGAM|nr:unnamed protein product [Rhizoctonia solani]